MPHGEHAARNGVRWAGHAIFCALRGNFDLPVTAEADDAVTVTVTSTSGLSDSASFIVGTGSSGSASANVLLWSEMKNGWAVGKTKSFTMPDADVVTQMIG